MKIALKQSSLFLGLVSAFAMSAAASDALIEKTKNYTKTYPLSGNDRVNWKTIWRNDDPNLEQNEVKVDVVITARSGTEERAQQILQTIEIKDGKSGAEVWFKTDMDEHKNMSNKKNNSNYKDEGFTINYVVSLPSTTTLDASNSFGQMIFLITRSSLNWKVNSAD